ncbi:MAG: helix-turn-helix domain-containing protein [Candidatus Competibacteraceae bacterium]|nr:MAG: helix-turn-helix domain-containing protein [Candidatus Competibacteraceae bacterium]
MPNEIAADFTPSMTDAKAGPESLSLGAWLAQVRTDYDAGQRDVAHHLGLNPTLIQAIESDDFARLGPPVFVRGYLSRYARLLNLPEAAVLERYRQQTGVGQDPPPLKVVHPRRRQTRVRDLRGLFYLLLIVGVGWTAVQHLGDLDPGKLMALWSSDPSEDRPLIANQPTTTTQTRYPFQSESSGTPATPSQPAPAEPASTPLVPPVTVKSPAPAESPATAEAFSAPAMESTSPASSDGEPAAVALASSAAGSEEHDDDDPVAPPLAQEARLTLEFSDDCWVEVKSADGGVLFSGLMKANTKRQITGTAPFSLTLGNAPAARITLDDRPIDTTVYVPRRGTVSRFTLDRAQL